MLHVAAGNAMFVASLVAKMSRYVLQLLIFCCIADFKGGILHLATGNATFTFVVLGGKTYD